MARRHCLALAGVGGALVESPAARADDGAFTIGAADCGIANPDPRPRERAT